MRQATKIWTGVGAFVLVGSSLAGIPQLSDVHARDFSIADDSAIASDMKEAESLVTFDGDVVLNAMQTEDVAQVDAGGEGGEGYGGNDFEDVVSGADLRHALRAGGHVIYFRHATTEKDYADQADPNIDLGDCSTQRTLSEYGWRQSIVIRDAFEDMGIPVGEVISSQYCRAWQTAQLAFDRYDKTADLNFYPAEAYTDEQFAQMRDAVMPYLVEVPEAGTNRVLVGHDDVFESAAGIYPEPQGIAYVLTPDGQGGFELVANMTPEDWALLAASQ